MLLHDTHAVPHTIHIEDELDNLRQKFWQHTIGEVIKLIHEHILQAHEALDELEAEAEVTVFRGWLDTLEAAARAAMKGRNEALQFIQAYEGRHA
jgi:hypothetical protein